MSPGSTATSLGASASRGGRRRHARRRVRRSASACRRTCSTRSCGASSGTFPHVRLRYGTELMAFAETADGVVAQMRDAATGETEDDHGRLSGRHRRRRQPGARTRRHHHERQSGADLHHQRDVPLRGLSLAARQGPGLPLHLHRTGGHLAHHRGDQRRRPLPHVDRRLRRQGDPHRGRYPRRARARHGPRHSITRFCR